ncbi:tumor necrosis factor receptor superfamily member 13B isoform X1 [Sylvia atricapilla]|uniref:tumor necrosis factor receptor superfamily member 13B isoform X1 n=1 Tax=Sylvia atricapilla TaxID=48155 RepID=UPI003395AF0E
MGCSVPNVTEAERFKLRETLKTILSHPLPCAGTPSPRPGCSKPHSIPFFPLGKRKGPKLSTGGNPQHSNHSALKFFPSGGHRHSQPFPCHKATPEVSELPHLCPTATPAAVLEQKACAEQDPWLVLYLLLGLCLCSLICSLLLGWTHLRRKGEGVSCQASAGTCHCKEDTAKDRLVEAGSVGDGFTSIRIPEPVETCGFCFPGHGSAVQETKSCHSSSCQPGERAAPSFSGICSTGSAGAIPSPDDGHFKIICSPAQEKTPVV